jgi:hypothetical protein
MTGAIIVEFKYILEDLEIEITYFDLIDALPESP